MKNFPKAWLVSLVAPLTLALTACSDSEAPAVMQAEESQQKPVVVYSSRKEHLIKPFFEQFTAETGIPVEYITDKAGPLVSRLKSEGERTPADIFMTVDAGNLWYAKQQGILQPIESQALELNIPEHLQDPENQWFGLTVRARTIVYSTERVKAADLSSYQDLANAQWKSRLCLRTSQKVYNQSLVAMLIARDGEENTQQVLSGWVDNLAVAPFSNDTKVMNAIVAGKCDVGIVNTYYFGRLQKENPQIPLALFWPNQEESQKGGVHVNISGAGLTKHAKNKAGAIKLIEWLSSEQAQEKYAGENMEYPVNLKVAPTAAVAAWGSFAADDMNLSQAGELQPSAIKLMDTVGYK